MGVPVSHGDRERLLATIQESIEQMDDEDAHKRLMLVVPPNMVATYRAIVSTTDYADAYVMGDRRVARGMVQVGRYEWWAEQMRSGELD